MFQFSASIRKKRLLDRLAVRGDGQAVAALAAGDHQSDGAARRLLLGAGAARISNHFTQHEQLQQQELVATAQQHRPRLRAAVVHLRAAERRAQEREGPRYRTHSARTLRLPQSLEQELLQYHQQVYFFEIPFLIMVISPTRVILFSISLVIKFCNFQHFCSIICKL